jgi:CheY-like chemotaxis protein
MIPARFSTARRAVSTGRPNTLNLDPQALTDLLNRLDEREAASTVQYARDYVRWPYRRLSVEVQIVHPGGNKSVIYAACRNISNGGICLLHNSYIHPGSACVVTLKHPIRGDVRLPGTVVRCMHRSGVVHELGIRFNTPILAREFVLPDPFSNSFSVERVRPAELKGRVLLVEPSEVERLKVAMCLGETSLELITAASLAEAIVKCENIDVAMVSSELPDGEPLDAAARLRQAGFHGPLVVMVPDASEATRRRVEKVEATAFVTRPLTDQVVLRAIADVLHMGRAVTAARAA